MTTSKSIRTCANCDKAAVAAYNPFCSKRCADMDLGRWLNESYTIPAVEPPDDWSEDGNEEY
ncbi:MAG: DNA gyrase inhibitor YacG [Rhodospirillaceae bacterium]|jgi:uncharacterized protein|nr:DNA gyrase inhibitor YacG [Rhodospirillaceae bacterium]MBT5191494.1 DNA gyrase inhibitor YacG [Rhodospirillaceae bacterium]MBT5899301.1 DNA gyrase inhibitor YacG [Rhodospirillaceae bacterium]MBT6429082.1 DNA gyrase inhibitor YacG [Rhodospirillaceae bacterium]MBT7760010.1 DNA gyrase inhibitor YacG [Rhodospirillaceae bacterium]